MTGAFFLNLDVFFFSEALGEIQANTRIMALTIRPMASPPAHWPSGGGLGSGFRAVKKTHLYCVRIMDRALHLRAPERNEGRCSTMFAASS